MEKFESTIEVLQSCLKDIVYIKSTHVPDILVGAEEEVSRLIHGFVEEVMQSLHKGIANSDTISQVEEHASLSYF